MIGWEGIWVETRYQADSVLKLCQQQVNNKSASAIPQYLCTVHVQVYNAQADAFLFSVHIHGHFCAVYSPNIIRL